MTGSTIDSLKYGQLTNSCKLLACIVIGNQIEEINNRNGFKPLDAPEPVITVQQMINDPNTRGIVTAAMEAAQAVYQCEINLDIQAAITYYKTVEQERLAAIEASKYLLVTDPRYVDPEKAKYYTDVAESSKANKEQLEKLLKTYDATKKDFDDCSASILTKQNQINELTELLTKTKENQQTLSSLHERALGGLKEIEDKLQALQKAAKEPGEKPADSAKILRSVKKQILEIKLGQGDKAKLDDLEKQRDQLEAELANPENFKNTAQGQQIALLDQLTKQRTDINYLQEKIELLQTQITTQEEQIKTLQNAVTIDTERLKEVAKKLSELQEQIVPLAKKLEEAATVMKLTSPKEGPTDSQSLRQRNKAPTLAQQREESPSDPTRLSGP